MKRLNLFLLLAMLISNLTFAGGLLTNTNQNVAFLRNPCRDASIGIDGVYNNPAGLNFMSQGWHLSLNFQSVYQNRAIDTQNPNYKYGKENNGSDTKRFKGKASAPVVPSLQLAYVKDRWAVSASFAITGGGGKCTFDNGLGTFENVVSMLPSAVNKMTQEKYGHKFIDTYSADMYMKGKQYYYGMQLGAGYKITDNLSAYVGGRLILADCNYYGYMENIMLQTNAIAQGAGLPAEVPIGYFLGNENPLSNGIRLDCDQSGWSFMTVLGLDYKIEKWNFAAKYEFYGRMHLKNQSNLTQKY
ncbi:MAG: transporter, partial [Bacteroidaceae bacterium]